MKAAEEILQGTQNTVDDTLSALDSILNPPQPQLEPQKPKGVSLQLQGICKKHFLLTYSGVYVMEQQLQTQ